MEKFFNLSCKHNMSKVIYAVNANRLSYNINCIDAVLILKEIVTLKQLNSYKTAGIIDLKDAEELLSKYIIKDVKKEELIITKEIVIKKSFLCWKIIALK